jgi:hypothetical protein
VPTFIWRTYNEIVPALLGTDLQAGAGRYTKIWRCAFDALGLLVLQTPPDERRSTRLVGPNRHVLVWLTVMFLLIATSYSSGLASILTVPRYYAR